MASSTSSGVGRLERDEATPAEGDPEARRRSRPPKDGETLLSFQAIQVVSQRRHVLLRQHAESRHVYARLELSGPGDEGRERVNAGFHDPRADKAAPCHVSE